MCFQCNTDRHHSALCPRVEEDGQAKPSNVRLTLTKHPNSVNSPAAVPTPNVKVIKGRQVQTLKYCVTLLLRSRSSQRYWSRTELAEKRKDELSYNWRVVNTGATGF